MANDESKSGVIFAVGAAALLVGGFGGALIADDSDKVDKLTADLEAKGEPIIVEKIVEVEVPVDSDNLEVVLKHLYDSEGNVNYLLDDLDDDELDQIVDRIVFVNEAKDKATAYIKGLDFGDELEDEDKTFVSGIDEEENDIVVNVDEDEVKRVRVQDDDDEVFVSEIDFDDSDAYVTVDVKFEHDGIKLIVPVVVEIKDNKVEDFEFGNVTLRQ